MEKGRSKIIFFTVFFLLGIFQYTYSQTVINSIVIRNSTLADSLALTKYNRNIDVTKTIISNDYVFFYYRGLGCDTITFSTKGYIQTFYIEQSKFAYLPKFIIKIEKNRIRNLNGFHVVLNDCNRMFSFILNKDELDLINTIIIEPTISSSSETVSSEDELNNEFVSIRQTKYDYELLKMLWKNPR